MYVCVSACPHCNIELVFLLDSSTKTNDAWKLILNFVSDVVRQYDIRQNCVRVAVIRYSNTADAPIRLNSYSDVNRLVQAIGQIQLLGGTASNLNTALDLLRSQVVRPNAVRIVIIITDNLQRNPVITNAANNAKSQGIILVGVAITGPGRVDVNYFNMSIVSDFRLVVVNTYGDLTSGARNTISRDLACIEYTTTPAPSICEYMMPVTFYRAMLCIK